MQLLISSYLFLVGAVLGSFVGAMAWRYKHAMPLTTDRSECEQCHHKLGVGDLLPVVSWLWLRGKCRYCGHAIGVQTFALEVLLGVAFVFSYLFWPYGMAYDLFWPHFAIWLVALTMLAFLFVYDARHFILPDVVTVPLMALGLILLGFHSQIAHWTLTQAGVEALLSLLPVSGVYWVLYKVSGGRWVGFGDVKLGVFIGLVLGWQGAIFTLFLSNVLGTLYILPGILLGRLSRKDHVPFGPFLIVATFIAFLGAQQIIDWYFAQIP